MTNFKFPIINQLLNFRSFKSGVYLVFVSSLVIVSCFLMFAPSAQAGTIVRSPAYLGLQRGLAGCWTFDGAYDKAPDCSVNNNTGTLTGGPTKTKGKIGQALGFDGVNDHVIMPNESQFDFSDTTFTVTGWVDSDDDGGGCPGIISKNDGGDGGWVLCSNSGGTLTVLIRNAGDDSAGRSSNSIITDRFHHFAVIMTTSTATSAGNDIAIYIDGTLDQGSISRFGTVYAANNDTVKVGNRTSSGYFQGKVDDVRVYNRALSAGEINRLYRIGLGSTVNRSSTSSSWNKGLVGHWTFDGADIGNSGAMAKDRSGNSNNGTIENPGRQVPGKVGQALNFNGVNDYVSLGNPTVLIPGNTITLSLWFYVSGDTGAAQMILAKDDGGAPTNETELRLQGLGALCRVGGTSATGTTITINRWYHFVCTYDGSNVIAYLNGVEDARTAKSGAIADETGINWLIGARAPAAPAFFFKGRIDDVRIYNRPLSVSEIQNLYRETQSKFNVSQTDSLTKGLVGCWTFDGAYEKVPDCSGNNNTGTLTNSPTKVRGKVGQALQFNGSNTYVNTGARQGPQSAATFSAWVKLTSTATTRIILGQYKTSNNSYMQFITQNGTLSGRIQQAIDTIFIGRKTSTAVLKVGQWAHVLYTWSGGTTNSAIKVYVNGIQVDDTDDGAGTFTAPYSGSDINFLIGAQFDASSLPSVVLNGIIDEVRVYNRALSVGEIQKLYNMGR